MEELGESPEGEKQSRDTARVTLGLAVQTLSQQGAHSKKRGELGGGLFCTEAMQTLMSCGGRTEPWAVPWKQRGPTGSVLPHWVPSRSPAQARVGSGEGAQGGATQGVKGWKPCGPGLHGLPELSKRLKALSISTFLERRNLTDTLRA